MEQASPTASLRTTQRPGVIILLGLFYFAALVSRRPSALLRPQFWAEDGKLFYQQAHELGFFDPFLIPYNGYLHTLPRLTAGLSLLFPLSAAPLVFSLVGLLTQALPAIFLSSSRAEKLAPLSVRILLGFLYVGVPNVARIHGNMANAQWHLAVLGFLILVTSPPKSVWAAIFDVTALSICAVTGPFAIMLLPVAFVVARKHRDVWALRRAGILCVGALITLTTVLSGPRSSVSLQGLGATVPAFCRIMTFQIFFPVFRGINNSAQYARSPALLSFLSYAVTAAGLATLAYVVRRGSMEVRCFLLFAALLLTASLASPLASATEPQWVAMQRPGATHRYWLIPEVAVAVAFVALASTATRPLVRAVAAGFVCVMLIVDIAYWRLPDLHDFHFNSHVAAFRSLPIGGHIRIPIPPNWSIDLTKTQRD